MLPTTAEITCPLCKRNDLHVEDAAGTHLGFAPMPEGGPEGSYFPGLARTDVVYCDECGEVTVHEVTDAVAGSW